jgi:hypothetical protein
MDRSTLQKKLDLILDEFERSRTFGSIEIVFRNGEPDVIHKLVTEKFQNGRENIHQNGYRSK